jgi:hypothetical protein
MWRHYTIHRAMQTYGAPCGLTEPIADCYNGATCVEALEKVTMCIPHVQFNRR